MRPQLKRLFERAELPVRVAQPRGNAETEIPQDNDLDACMRVGEILEFGEAQDVAFCLSVSKDRRRTGSTVE